MASPGAGLADMAPFPMLRPIGMRRRLDGRKVENMNSSPEIVALLSTPEAREEYARIRREPWAEAFMECGHPLYHRLGARILLAALVGNLDPGRVEQAAYDEDDRIVERRRGRPIGSLLHHKGQRGTCLVCKEDVSVKKDGTARAHPKGAPECAGSGLPVR